MGQKEKIALIEREELGPVPARADHRGNAIEINKAVFYGLPPMVQEFVLCHEVCHLRYHEWDEARTNLLAARVFLARAANDDDLEKRCEFLSYLAGDGSTSNFWAELTAGLLSLGGTVFGIIRQRNSGWYSWSQETQKANVDTMLKQAFEQSRKSTSQSAAAFFWRQMQAYTYKDDSLEEFLDRSGNGWVRDHINKFEREYGFYFNEVTPFDITAYPLAMVALVVLLGAVVYKIIKNRKK